MAGMTRVNIALAAMGWIARLLAAGLVFWMVVLWLLIPFDPRLTDPQNTLVKLKLEGIAAVGVLALVWLSKWCLDSRRKD